MIAEQIKTNSHCARKSGLFCLGPHLRTKRVFEGVLAFRFAAVSFQMASSLHSNSTASGTIPPTDFFGLC